MSTDPGRAILLAVVTAVVSLLVMESYQTTPWLAHRLMQWSVRLRYTDNPARAKLRGEELTALLGDLPTLFTLPTASAFLLRALAYRLAHRRRHARREPRTVQRSLGARFRIALVKANLVVVCAGAVFGIDLFLLRASLVVSFLGSVLAGVLAAVESMIRPSRFPRGLFGGIVCALIVFILYGVLLGGREASSIAFFSGVEFGVVTRLACALVGKFKHVVGVVSLVLATLFAPYGTWWLLSVVVVFSGVGLAAGVLWLDSRAVMIRRSNPAPTPAVLADSLSGSDAVNREPPIAIGEPSRHE